LAAALKENAGIEPKLIEGSGGVFDVTLDGELIFSKKITGRFPEDAEIVEAVNA
jgi:selenoprotein W-related protein